MKSPFSLRSISIALVCLVLAVVLAMQAAGIVLTKRAPDIAVTLFPANGLAHTNLASAAFASEVSAQSTPNSAAAQAEPWARTSHRLEPLSPQAHAILALAQQEEDKSASIVDAASRLDRRDPTLQALVLQKHVEAEEFVGVIRSLDRILRVRPSRSNELFRVLMTVFAREDAVEEFANVLDGSSPWHQKFIDFALNDPAAVQSLYRLRSMKRFDPDQDRKLIERLAGAGELQSAYQLYEQVSEPEEAAPSDRTLSWSSDNPPFDWWFVDDADFRAQPRLGSDDLEVYARAGQGGVIARRIIRTPSVPFSLNLTHSLSPRTASEDVRLSLQCADSRKPVAEQAFGASAVSLRVEDLPPDCDFVEIAVTGRAWTGQSTLRGDMSPIALR